MLIDILFLLTMYNGGDMQCLTISNYHNSLIDPMSLWLHWLYLARYVALVVTRTTVATSVLDQPKKKKEGSGRKRKMIKMWHFTDKWVRRDWLFHDSDVNIMSRYSTITLPFVILMTLYLVQFYGNLKISVYQPSTDFGPWAEEFYCEAAIGNAMRLSLS